MQELTFEQVEVVAGASKIKGRKGNSTQEQSSKEVNGSDGGGSGGNGSWFTPGSGEFTCCFGADLFKVNLGNIAADLGSFTNPNLVREQDEAKQLQ